MVETASGLQHQVLTPGAGEAKPTDADVTLIQYEGRLINGTVFDKTQQPTPLPVTAVVPGFSEALKLMQKGGKSRFWIKPSLAYGDEATGPIPAHSILVFDIELLDFISESGAPPDDARRAAAAAGWGPTGSRRAFGTWRGADTRRREALMKRPGLGRPIQR